MLVGSEEPRLWTKPLRPLTEETSLGFRCIAFAEVVLGIRLDPWQRWFLIHALELNPDGSFRYRTILLLVARQNGKTTVMRVLTLWALWTGRVKLAIGTAQDLDVARECWREAALTAMACPDLAEDLDGKPRTANGQEELAFANGSRYKIKATTEDAARGIPGVGLLLADELRTHKTYGPWGAMSKTAMAVPNALIVGMSNAGDKNSVVLNDLRTIALAETDDTLGIFEWSAPVGCPIDDRDGWAQANPSLGNGRLTERALLSAMQQDPEGVFRTECLCQWVEDLTPTWRILSPSDWARCSDPAYGGALPTIALEVAYDRTTATFAGAGQRPDRRAQIGIVEHDVGTEWVVPWARATWGAGDRPGPLVVDPKGPAGFLIPQLRDARIPLVEVDLAGLINAYAYLTQGVGDEHDSVRHLNQVVLTAAVEVAAPRVVGDRLTFDRKICASSPAVAASLALGRVLTQRGGRTPSFAFV